LEGGLSGEVSISAQLLSDSLRTNEGDQGHHDERQRQGHGPPKGPRGNATTQQDEEHRSADEGRNDSAARQREEQGDDQDHSGKERQRRLAEPSTVLADG